MQQMFKCLSIFLFFAINSSQIQATTNYRTIDKDISFTVIGAGPSGIATVGILLDCGMPADRVVWIDPEFNAGRLSTYANVPGNATVNQYINFIKACAVFTEVKTPAIEALFASSLTGTPKLHVIVEPLIDITNYLRTKVVSVADTLISLDFHDDLWHIKTTNALIKSSHVVLATGSHPRELNYEGVPHIPFDVAIDKSTLATHVTPEDTIGVIGSAHSALLIVRHLTELPVGRIINFYKRQITYPTPMNGGVAYQEIGLKGELAQWTKTVLANNPPVNLLRVFSDDTALKTHLPECTKLIYACGFDRNEIPGPNSDPSLYAKYDSSSGAIGHRLFGVGIAFPQQRVDPLGNAEYLVGLPFFMPYIQSIVPEWMKKNINRKLYEFEKLFTIAVL